MNRLGLKNLLFSCSLLGFAALAKYRPAQNEKDGSLGVFLWFCRAWAVRLGATGAKVGMMFIEWLFDGYGFLKGGFWGYGLPTLVVGLLALSFSALVVSRISIWAWEDFKDDIGLVVIGCVLVGFLAANIMQAVYGTPENNLSALECSVTDASGSVATYTVENMEEYTSCKSGSQVAFKAMGSVPQEKNILSAFSSWTPKALRGKYKQCTNLLQENHVKLATDKPYIATTMRVCMMLEGWEAEIREMEKENERARDLLEREHEKSRSLLK